jgi:hypothetical protein
MRDAGLELAIDLGYIIQSQMTIFYRINSFQLRQSLRKF